MAKFFVDAFADMFGDELKTKGLELAPSKIKYGRKTINFEGWQKESEDITENIKARKYSFEPLTQQEWRNFLLPFLQAGEDIAFFTISKKLFKDGGSDLQAAFSQLSEEFPERKVLLVDTLTVSRGTSELAVLAKTIYNTDKDLEKAIQFVTNLAGQFITAFVVDDAKYLNHSPILEQVGSELMGGLINVKPIISINKSGNFKLLDKSRGFKSGVRKLFSTVKVNGENIADFTFSIVHYNAEAEAESLKEKFLQCMDESDIKVVKASLNNAIIVGPKFVGITFHAK